MNLFPERLKREEERGRVGGGRQAGALTAAVRTPEVASARDRMICQLSLVRMSLACLIKKIIFMTLRFLALIVKLVFCGALIMHDTRAWERK